MGMGLITHLQSLSRLCLCHLLRLCPIDVKSKVIWPHSCSLTSPASTSQIWSCTTWVFSYHWYQYFSLLFYPRWHQVNGVSWTLPYVNHTDRKLGRCRLLCSSVYSMYFESPPPSPSGVVPPSQPSLSPSCLLTCFYQLPRPTIY